MSQPLAYFLTRTCHGTWLHGDERGSVDRERNVPETPFIQPQRGFEAHEQSRSTQSPVRLTSEQRSVVQATIEAHCAYQTWDLFALNVRTNHVHVVVSCGDAQPEIVMGQFKSWCTRRLREADLINKDARIWTRHGSTKYLWKPPGVEAAIRYVNEEQGRNLDEA
jgi:REP element-mobilizing transposase RayT